MRKNFKARMTAKNMNITEYNKETLIRLMNICQPNRWVKFQGGQKEQ